jgi:FXSXX-COOH protein
VEQSPADHAAVLVDLTGISLIDLTSLDDSALSASIRRLRRELADETTVVSSGFESFIDVEQPTEQD